MMTQDEMKQAVARAALEHVVPNTIIGIGTGSTANFFIDALAEMKDQINGTVASSEASAERLRGHGVHVFEPRGAYVPGSEVEEVSQLELHVPGGLIPLGYVDVEVVPDALGIVGWYLLDDEVICLLPDLAPDAWKILCDVR